MPHLTVPTIALLRIDTIELPHDPGVIDQIITCISPAHGERLVEIGPGRGAITVELLNAAGALDVVELDRDLVLPLAELCRGQGDLRIHNCGTIRGR